MKEPVSDLKEPGSIQYATQSPPSRRGAGRGWPIGLWPKASYDEAVTVLCTLMVYAKRMKMAKLDKSSPGSTSSRSVISQYWLVRPSSYQL